MRRDEKEEKVTEDRCRKNLEEALADCMVMALRLLGESDRTFSPECAEVMARWGPIPRFPSLRERQGRHRINSLPAGFKPMR
jgi:hypothetical protein